MAAVLFFVPYQAVVINGLALPNAKLYFYSSGTSTKESVFYDDGLTTPATNPVITNSGGQIPAIYLDDTLTYRLVIKDENDDDLGIDIDPFVPGTVPDASVLQPYADAAADSAAAAAASSAEVLAALAAITPSSASVNASSRLILSAVDSSLGAANLTEAGRQGLFCWSSSNHSADVTLDTQQGMYVAPTGDPTGASGAWVRANPVITPYHFGAVGDNATNDTTAFTAFGAMAFRSGNPTPQYYFDFSGRFAISGNIVLGPSSTPGAAQKFNVGGFLRLTQLTATFETLRLKNFNKQVWKGGIKVVGVGSSSFASRTCGVGIAFENCGNSRIDYVAANFFWLTGMVTPTVSNDALQIGLAIISDCGSGQSGGSLTATYNGLSNANIAASYSQRTTISNVSAFPASTVTTYESLGNQALFVLVSGKPYLVTTFDSVAGTVNVFPWIDSFTATSGTLTWVIGGGFVDTTSDGNIINFGHFNAQVCGQGFVAGSLYGARLNSANINNTAIGITLGKNTSNANIGTSIDALYTEANTYDVVLVATPENSGTAWGHINSAYILDLTKILALCPRNTDGTPGANGGSLGTANANGFSISFNGRVLTVDGPNNFNAENSTVSFTDHKRPPRIKTRYRNSHTIALTIVDEGFHRLFGYKSSTVRYVGTGTNNAPTGTFTFTPDTKAYTSCTTTGGSAVVTMANTAGLIAGMPITGTGIPASTTISSVDSATQIHLSANATASGTATLTVTARLNGVFTNATFSTFTGVVDFSIGFKDPYQLDWVVAKVTG